MTDPKLESLRAAIADHLVEIEKLIPWPVELTVIARDPSRPDGTRDILLTSDDEEKAIAAIRRVMKEPAVRHPLAPPIGGTNG